MTYRTRQPQGPPARCPELVASGKIAFVEMEYPRKWIPRATPDLRIEAGAHAVRGISNSTECSSKIVCLHAPLRSRRVLEKRAQHGRRLLEAGFPHDHGWQNQRWYRLSLEGKLDDDWRTNTAEDGYLEVGDRRSQLVFDPRLKHAVAPWIARSSWSWVMLRTGLVERLRSRRQRDGDLT